MATFKSQIITQVSGSVGGLTYAHNKGGLYFRARRTPTNPNTPFQQAVRGTMNDLVNLWNTTLTELQRVAWRIYAINTPVVGKLGDSQTLTGLQMYVRSNVPRIQAGQARIDDAPTTYNLGSYTNPSMTVDATADEADVTFTDGDTWANEDGAYALIYLSRPQNPGIVYFKGPYRFAGTIAGDAMTPPTSPATIALPFPAVADQKVFCKWSVSRADGRLSTPFRFVATAT